MTIGERIKTRRKQLGLTLEEVGKAVGVAKTTVKKWEDGVITHMRIDKVEKLAGILATSPAFLMEIEEDYFAYKNIEPLPNMRQVPILGSIACGVPLLAKENIEGYAEVENSVHADFALRCIGDSMIAARIFDGDLVFIRSQPDVENGEIAAVLIDEEATLKRVYKSQYGLELRPENPTFPVLNYAQDDLHQVKIIGKAVAFFSRVR